MSLGPDNLLGDLTAVIPAYRCARFLTATVQSALLCRPREIIIAEDCSGDETLETAQELRSRHTGIIRVIAASANQGVTRNLNHAVTQVRTSFILKIDGDDIALPLWVRGAYQFIHGQPDLSILCGGGRRIGPDDLLAIESEDQLVDSSFEEARVLRGIDACRFILRWNPNPISSGAIFRTQSVLAAGGYDEHLTWAEDREIWFRLARNWAVGYAHAPSALYRWHPNSATAIHRAHGDAALIDRRIIQGAMRLWPETELRPDFGREFYRIARECLRNVRPALAAGDFRGVARSGFGCIYSAGLAGCARLGLPVFKGLRGRWEAVSRPMESANPLSEKAKRVAQ